MKSYTAQIDELNSPKIGLILLQADETLEGDMRQLMPNSAEIHVTRMRSAAAVSTASLKAIDDEIMTAASLFPFGTVFDAVGFACTSGAAEIGSERIAEQIKAVCEARYVTNPIDALLAACESQSVSRFAILSPYVEAVNLDLIAALKAKEIEVVELGSFNIATEAQVVRISPQSIRATALDLAQTDADALFISCTNLRTLSIIDGLEAETGRPVFSSNQVLLWHLASLAGLTIKGPGRLFD